MLQKNQNAPDYTLERLFSYALWYTGKYRVSRAKLLEKLRGKSKNEAHIAQVLVQLNPYHSDSIEIRSVVESCLARSKPVQYVKNSLRQKKFETSDILQILEEYDGFDEYANFQSAIEKRIRSLIEK